MGILLSKLVPKSIRGRAHALLTRTLPSRWYWRFRYWYGWGSGPGSRGELAKFKADFLNDFVERNGVASVVEFGCGDGEQLALLNYPRYVGFDVSRVAIKRCQRRFSSDSTKRFSTALTPISADLAISLDVIFHLVEQAEFEAHMRCLFASSRRFVIIYSSNFDGPKATHQIRHRTFGDWIKKQAPHWQLRQFVPNAFPLLAAGKEVSFSDFYVYEHRSDEVGQREFEVVRRANG